MERVGELGGPKETAAQAPAVASSVSGKLVDVTQVFKRHTPYRCVVSNASSDFLAHTIYVVQSADYFRALVQMTKETFQLDSGVTVPRIRVMFDDALLECYLHWAYTSEVEIYSVEQLCVLCKFANYINSSDLLAYIDRAFCRKWLNDLLTNQTHSDQLHKLADEFQLCQLKQALVQHECALEEEMAS